MTSYDVIPEGLRHKASYPVVRGLRKSAKRPYSSPNGPRHHGYFVSFTVSLCLPYVSTRCQGRRSAPERPRAIDIAALRQHFAAPYQPRDDEGADGGERRCVCNHCGCDVTATTTRMRSHLNVCPHLNDRFLPGNGFIARAADSERPVGSPAPSGTVLGSREYRYPLLRHE